MLKLRNQRRERYLFIHYRYFICFFVLLQKGFLQMVTLHVIVTNTVILIT